MIHNSVIIELSGSSCQHRKYILPTAAAPLQSKSPPKLETLDFQLKVNFKKLISQGQLPRGGGSRSDV